MLSIDGELTLGLHDHFSCDPVEVQLEQIPQLGGSKAYPDQPFCDCKSVTVMAELDAGGVGLPLPLTVIFTMAFDDWPHLSHS